MERIKLSQKEIAECFSNGNFDPALPYLAKNITWDVIGEKVFVGRVAVVANCKQTSEYFNTLQTDFRTNNIIVKENKVVISGTAEFIRDGKRVGFISACDIYEFNSNNELEKISSYCIPEKKLQ